MSQKYSFLASEKSMWLYYVIIVLSFVPYEFLWQIDSLNNIFYVLSLCVVVAAYFTRSFAKKQGNLITYSQARWFIRTFWYVTFLSFFGVLLSVGGAALDLGLSTTMQIFFEPTNFDPMNYIYDMTDRSLVYMKYGLYGGIIFLFVSVVVYIIRTLCGIIRLFCNTGFKYKDIKIDEAPSDLPTNPS